MLNLVWLSGRSRGSPPPLTMVLAERYNGSMLLRFWNKYRLFLKFDKFQGSFFLVDKFQGRLSCFNNSLDDQNSGTFLF